MSVMGLKADTGDLTEGMGGQRTLKHRRIVPRRAKGTA